MKKIVLSLALLAGISATAQAQTGARFGLKAGVVAATLAGKDVEALESLTGKLSNRFGFQAGVTANVGFSDLLSFQPELLYSQKGYQAEDGADDVKATSHFIDLPLLLRVNADGPFFEAGPQLGFLAGQTYKQGDDSESDTEGLRKFEIGYIAGLGYQLESGLSLGVRYNGAFTSIFDEGDVKVRNSVFQFQVGYLFGGK